MNFDDIDLGIFALCFLALIGSVAGIFLKVDAATLFSFLALCGTGVAGLVTGKSRKDSNLNVQNLDTK